EGCAMSSVAVKSPETSTPGLLDRLHVGTLAGVVYFLGSLAIIFKLLPLLWWNVLALPATAVSTTFLVVAAVAVAGGLGYLGARLLGPHPTPGVKAGIFTVLVALLFIALLTRGASLWLEDWVYKSRSLSETVGIALTAGVAVVLLA